MGSHAETERKYDVDAATVFPNLAETDGVASVGQPNAFHLEAVYFDTADLDLARSGVTLRRRTGGKDAGWHLKLPAGGDTRTELGEPLGDDERAVPESFRARVHALSRGRELRPVAIVTTERREYALTDAAGCVLALVSDDTVQGQYLDGDEPELAWREWEVELADGSPELLDVVEERLLAAGASPAAVGSKLARVVGVAPAALSKAGTTTTPETGRAKRKGKGKGKVETTVRELLSSQLAQHLARLLEQDAGVRADQTEAVHRVRIAARRLRSALTTFRPLLDTSVTDPVREELRWVGEEFAVARDAQVLREHLGEVLAHEPAELVVGPVSTRLDEELGKAYESGKEEARRALDSERYVRLLDTIEGLISAPPLQGHGDRPARKVLPGLLARDVKRLGRAVREIEAAADPGSRDLAVHEARKKAKRLRYAAESATPVLGKRAKSLGADTKKIQETLGIHQDTVVARRRLREFAVQAYLDGQNAFTFGRLHGLEQARAERAERDFETLWAGFGKKQLRRWAP
ncbi:CHAD domain-containing protein [Terrabacter sp. BE26]|uniref:CYTH and CHAD domain-containing protein n=1 Tax=Terrabacter sp. BE26 TaxID=2898152 RepID=UPI0035BE9D58